MTPVYLHGMHYASTGRQAARPRPYAPLQRHFRRLRRTVYLEEGRPSPLAAPNGNEAVPNAGPHGPLFPLATWQVGR